MRFCLLLIALIGFPAAARATVLVDNFKTTQNLAISPAQASNSGGVNTNSNAIGGARWISLNAIDGIPTATSTITVNDGNNEILAFTPEDEVTVRTTLIYDGDFAGPHVNINPFGLGGLNLVATDDLTFQLLARSTAPVDAILFLYSFNTTSWYQFGFTFPGLGVDVAFSKISIDITTPDFVAGSGFSPLLLGALALTIDTGISSGLVQIDRMAFVPEPSSGALALFALSGFLGRKRFRRRIW
jgi:hypothetical protein